MQTLFAARQKLFKLTLKKGVILLLALGVTACASLIPSEHLIKQKKLTATLKKSFPLHRDVANGLFSVTLNTPELNLLTAQNRIGLAADFSAHAFLAGDITGHFVFTGALQYDTHQRAIFLQDASVDALQIEQESAYAEMLRPILNKVLNEYLRENPLYHFQPDELLYAGVEIEITDVKVVAEGINLKLHPKQKISSEKTAS